MRKGILATIVVVAAAAAAATTLPSAGASSAAGKNGTGAFRTDVVLLLQGLKPVAVEMNRRDRSGVRSGDVASLNLAIDSVESASPEQLAVLQRALAKYPQWRSLPKTLSKLMARTRRADVRGFRTKGAITPDDCPTARAAGYTQTDVEIAADTALAADAVLEAVPQDLLSEVVRIAAVAIWAIPQGVLRGFEHLYDIAQACDDADQSALIAGNLDVKVSSRATQTSVDTVTTNLATAVTNINNSFTSVQNTLSSLKTDIDNSFSAVSTQVTNVQNALTALKTDIDNSFSAVTTQISNVQTSVNTANTKIDALNVTVVAGNDLNLRLQIEEDLAKPGNHSIALFEVPNAQGGYLDLARTIVADIIQKMTAAGQSVGNGPSFLASGDQARAAGRFKDAYAAYSKAYQAAQ